MSVPPIFRPSIRPVFSFNGCGLHQPARYLQDTPFCQLLQRGRQSLTGGRDVEDGERPHLDNTAASVDTTVFAYTHEAREHTQVEGVMDVREEHTK